MWGILGEWSGKNKKPARLAVNCTPFVRQV